MDPGISVGYEGSVTLVSASVDGSEARLTCIPLPPVFRSHPQGPGRSFCPSATSQLPTASWWCSLKPRTSTPTNPRIFWARVSLAARRQVRGPSSGMCAEGGGIQHKMETSEQGAGKSPAVGSPSCLYVLSDTC